MRSGCIRYGGYKYKEETRRKNRVHWPCLLPFSFLSSALIDLRSLILVASCRDISDTIMFENISHHCSRLSRLLIANEERGLDVVLLVDVGFGIEAEEDANLLDHGLGPGGALDPDEEREANEGHAKNAETRFFKRGYRLYEA